jgi:hypothetical protein
VYEKMRVADVEGKGGEKKIRMGDGQDRREFKKTQKTLQTKTKLDSER